MIKKILIGLVALIILLAAFAAVASFALPTELKVEREITINRPRADVFAYVKYLKNQNEWGPWHRKEPTMKQEFRGTDGTVGFVSYWKGEKDETGEGEQEIKKITENERLDTELRFKQPFESTADAYLITEAAGENVTKVKWGFNGSMPRPFNLMCLVVDMDKELGKDFEEGLSSLKTVLEKP